MTRSADLHRENPTLVAHVDLPAELLLRRQAGQCGVLAADYGPRFQAAGVRAVVAAVFVHPMYLPQMALSNAMSQIGALLAEVDASGGLFRLVRTNWELDAALREGQIAVLLSLEGAEPLEGDPARLRAFYELGVRVLGLTWNNRNLAADGCKVPGAGLTDFGKEVVAGAQTLGIALDVSHLNDAGFADVLALTQAPVIASHSNCRALCAHPRNLTDAQIQALAARGGVIGLNQIRYFSESEAAGQGVQALHAHLMRLLTLAGPAHVGLGLDLGRDYMDVLPKPRVFWGSYDPNDEDILHDYADILPLTAALLREGISKEDAAGVLGGNFLRVLRQILQ